MRRFRTILLLLGAIGAGSAQAESGTRPYRFTPPKYAPPQSPDQSNFWVGLSGNSALKLSGLWGGTLGLGYQSDHWGADLRAQYALTNYGSIWVRPDTTTDAPTNPGAETYRSRTETDSWSFALAELGGSVAGRISPNWLPLLSQRARVGLGFGRFADATNNVVFHGYLASFEGALQYRLSPGSPLALELAIAYRYGELVRAAAPERNNAQLPLSFVTSSIGLILWL